MSGDSLAGVEVFVECRVGRTMAEMYCLRGGVLEKEVGAGGGVVRRGSCVDDEASYRVDCALLDCM